MFVAEGEDLVAAAFDMGVEPDFALVDAQRPALLDRLGAAEQVEPRLLADVGSLAHPPRVIAAFRRADLPAPIDSANLGLSLWRIADPGNVGTLLRCTDAFGGAFLALSPGCADPTGPKALRASAGAIFRVPLIDFDESPEPWVALSARGGVELAKLELAGIGAFVLGAEREGLPAEVIARCGAEATIPLGQHADSLNVAIAGAIALYEWRRRAG